MAGMKTRLQLIANETGDYSGRSTNYSGHGFSGMTFTARATTDADFTTWVQAVKSSNTKLDANTYYTLEKPSYDNPITTYASVQNHLFDNIIMKFMMPNMDDLSADHSNMKM
jgi:cytochrome o ubiquinol oxidase subunit 2